MTEARLKATGKADIETENATACGPVPNGIGGAKRLLSLAFGHLVPLRGQADAQRLCKQPKRILDGPDQARTELVPMGIDKVGMVKVL